MGSLLFQIQCICCPIGEKVFFICFLSKLFFTVFGALSATTVLLEDVM